VSLEQHVHIGYTSLSTQATTLTLNVILIIIMQSYTHIHTQVILQSTIKNQV